MKKLSTFATTTALVAALTFPAFAGPVGLSRPASDQPNQVTNQPQASSALAALQIERRDLAEQTSVTQGRRFREIDGQRLVTLDEIIEKLKNGASVSPEEIDRAMQK